MRNNQAYYLIDWVVGCNKYIKLLISKILNYLLNYLINFLSFFSVDGAD